jgi:hypothetical protein
MAYQNPVQIQAFQNPPPQNEHKNTAGGAPAAAHI